MNRLDDLIEYLVVTNQVDENFGLKPICPLCHEPLEKQDDIEYPFYCPSCKKEFNESLREYKEIEYKKTYRRR